MIGPLAFWTSWSSWFPGPLSICLLDKLDTTMPSIAKTVMPKKISSKVWQYFVDNKYGEYASCLLCKYHQSNGMAIFVG